VAIFKFFEKRIFKKKIKNKNKNFHGLTRILYGHGVNSNLTERTKLNLFR